jgi:hypothetical protein
VGERHALLRPYLKDAGLEYVPWSIRTRDTWNSGVLVRRSLNQAASGDIICCTIICRVGAHVMLEALPRVIDELRQWGFEFVLSGPREDASVATPEPAAFESAR